MHIMQHTLQPPFWQPGLQSCSECLLALQNLLACTLPSATLRVVLLKKQHPDFPCSTRRCAMTNLKGIGPRIGPGWDLDNQIQKSFSAQLL